MISELNDEQILDLLMTSEFEVDLSPTEFKFLLRKLRYFYRLLHGRLERDKDDFEFKIKNLEVNIHSMNEDNYKLLVENAKKDDFIDQMKNRKLSFKERLTGKIITKEDENK